MKYCKGCDRYLDESMFSKDRTHKDGLQSRCKDCRNKYRKKYYESHRQYHIEYATNTVKENKTKLYTYLQVHPCVECGESDPIVLEFDHINPEDKEASICWAICKWSWGRVLKEIEKCQVLCANCHKRKTAKQQGWYKFIEDED